MIMTYKYTSTNNSIARNNDMIIIIITSTIIITITATPSPPTKSSGFRGFDSSRLLILMGGNYHIHIIV